MYVGGVVEATEPARSSGKALSVAFTFGCQYSETGLFRTQKVSAGSARCQRGIIAARCSRVGALLRCGRGRC